MAAYGPGGRPLHPEEVERMAARRRAWDGEYASGGLFSGLGEQRNDPGRWRGRRAADDPAESPHAHRTRTRSRSSGGTRSRMGELGSANTDGVSALAIGASAGPEAEKSRARRTEASMLAA